MAAPHSLEIEKRVASELTGSNPGGPADLPFLRNTWYVAGWSSELQESGPIARTIINDPIALYRRKSGELVALQDRCAHRWAPLSLGRVEGDDLRCMYHGLRFAADGHCVEIPDQGRVPKNLCVRKYPTHERHRLIWVWMGDHRSADPRLIPDLGMLDQDWRRLYCGTLDYDANYSLVTDNLLDLSHFFFLHKKTLGRAVSIRPASQLTPYTPGGSEAKLLERGIRMERWIPGGRARYVLTPKKVPDGDLWTRTDFLVPGIFIAYEQMYPNGTAQRCNGHPPGPSETPLHDLMSIQAVTPMTARRTRYLYSLGPRQCDADEEETNAMWEITQSAFSEDLQMIQAQQRIIDAHPGGRMYGIAADRGLTLFRNLIKKLVASEMLHNSSKGSGNNVS
jgi:phenylpropionate dioxygenase-like ring-hydroxylating dioxygenase large terminal subunit